MRVGNLFATPERQGNLLLLLLLHFPLSTYSAAKESLSLSTSPSWMSKYFINNSNAVLGPAKTLKVRYTWRQIVACEDCLQSLCVCKAGNKLVAGLDLLR